MQRGNFTPGLRRSASWRDALRRGTAMVEVAVCLPVIIILVFGSIELAHYIHLKQDLTICAYEAAKVAAKEGKSQQDVLNRFNEIVIAKKLQNVTLSIAPNLNGHLVPGDQITVIATAPAESNKVMPVRYFQGRNLSATVVMVRQMN